MTAFVPAAIVAAALVPLRLASAQVPADAAPPPAANELPSPSPCPSLPCPERLAAPPSAGTAVAAPSAPPAGPPPEAAPVAVPSSPPAAPPSAASPVAAPSAPPAEPPPDAAAVAVPPEPPAASPVASPLPPPTAERRPIFLTARLGGFYPFKIEMIGPELGPGADVELGLGKRLTRRLAAEVSVGHYGASETARYFKDSPDRRKYALGVTVLTASVRAFPLPPTRLGIYGLAGAGLYRAKLEFMEVGGGGAERRSKRTDTPTGFHFGAGVDYAVDPSMRVGAEVKYAWVKGKYSAPGDATEFGYGGLRAAAAFQYDF